MEEDEEVVFENSCLHKYLSQVGVEDVTVVPVSRQQADDDSDKLKVCPPHYEQVNRNPGIKNLLSLPIRLCQQLQDNMVKPFICQVVLAIVNSSLLEDDDVRFLKSLQLPSQESNVTRTSQGAISFTSLLCLLLSYAALRGSLVFGMVSFIGLCGALLYWRQKYSWIQEVSSLNKFMECCNEFLSVIRKSIKLLQEMEVVSRGYAGITQRLSAARLEMNQTHKPSKQCPVLRRHLFLTLRKCVYELRAATIQLVREHPLCDDVDMNLMSAISLSNYGSCMTDKSEEDLLLSTDEFSLTAIKSMAELCVVHLSEFLHRVALCYVPEVQRSTSGWGHVTTLSLSALLRHLQTMITSHHTLIHRQYHYHWSGFTEEAVERSSHVTDHVTTTSRLQVAMHTVNLQLRDVFKSGLDIESLLGKDASVEVMDQQLTMLRAKLTNCLCSVDSVQLSMTSQEVDMGEDNSPVPIPPVESQVKVQGVKEVKSLIGMGEPVIEDQVFEGHTEDNEVICCDDDDWLSPSNKEKRKRDKLEALRLLSELKSVIAVRAVDMELRERRALERQAGICPTSEQAGNCPTRGQAGTCPTSWQAGTRPTSGQAGNCPTSVQGGTSPTSGQTGTCPTSGQAGTCPTSEQACEMDRVSARLNQMSGCYGKDGVSADCTRETHPVTDVERLGDLDQVQAQSLSVKCGTNDNDKLVSSHEIGAIQANVTAVSLGAELVDVDHAQSTSNAVVENRDHGEVCNPRKCMMGRLSDHSGMEEECECGDQDKTELTRSRGGAQPFVTGSVAFASNIAAMVALKSREMNVNCEETFGDDSDSSDHQENIGDENMCCGEEQ